MSTVAKRKVNKKQRQRNQEADLEKRLQRKLIRVLCEAGLSWSTWIPLIEIADSINGAPIHTACWCYNEVTKRERIIFSRRLLKVLPIKLLVKVLRHEMLHKAMYRGTKNVANQELMNYVLDAAINKILWMSDPKEMAKLGEFLFPRNSEGRLGLMAIMNPSISTPEVPNMDPNVKKLWEDIYWVDTVEHGKVPNFPVDQTAHDWWKQSALIGNTHVPDPMALYYKASALLNKEQKEEIKEEYAFIKATMPQSDGDQEGQGGDGDQDGESGQDGDSDGQGKKKKGKKGKASGKDGDGKGSKQKKSPDHPRGGKDKRRAVDKLTITLEKEAADIVIGRVRNNCQRGGGYSEYSALEAYFQKFVYNQKTVDTMDDLQKFIAQWETMHQVEAAVLDIYGTFKNTSGVDPFPQNLTRLGIEMVALGISGPEMPFYFNTHEEGEGGKKKICCYFDTSPSMDPFVPYMVWTAEWFDSCEECALDGGKFRGKYAFSEKVKGIPDSDWENFKKGEIRGGCGTSFDMVVEHAIKRIDQDKVDIVVVFTDGYSGVSDRLVEEFNKTGKKCYTLYFAHEGYSSWGTKADGNMTSDLDKLNGKAYTIKCSGEDD